MNPAESVTVPGIATPRPWPIRLAEGLWRTVKPSDEALMAWAVIGAVGVGVALLGGWFFASGWVWRWAFGPSGDGSVSDSAALALGAQALVGAFVYYTYTFVSAVRANVPKD